MLCQVLHAFLPLLAYCVWFRGLHGRQSPILSWSAIPPALAASAKRFWEICDVRIDDEINFDFMINFMLTWKASQYGLVNGP